MDVTSLVLFLAIGAAAGWLAGQIMKTRKRSLVENMVVGVVGAYLGGFLFELVGLAAYGLIGALIMAVVGAVVLLYIVGMIKRK
jgi:uncharacterized membrane protein YeaQ/YmgE (transglycosylase-associated protein family)